MYQVIDGKVITNKKTYLKGDIIDEKLSKDDEKKLLDMNFIKIYKEKVVRTVVNDTKTDNVNENEKKLKQESKDKIIEKAKELNIDFNEEETKEEIIRKILEVSEQENDENDGPKTSI